ncbi:MAG: hypothetical protein D3913_11290, partial [Candidatus Electrothrix sp. LOE1_4_5]|nr:hypothetical protein [Candidatus Electrothrix gigas]
FLCSGIFSFLFIHPAHNAVPLSLRHFCFAKIIEPVRLSVSFAKKLRLRVGLKTNAWLLSDERLVRIIKYGLDDLYLSID